MNPIARLPADPLPEPRGESPTPGATGDADSAEFGLALALAAAAQSQAAVVPRATPVVAPAPIPSGDARDSAAAAATGTLAGNVTDALVTVPLPAPSASAPVPARPEPVRPPAVPSGNADAPATPVAAEAATVVRDAPPRTADLPLTIRVLEFVRGVTEQAARAALDTATSAGPAQAPDADERGRGRPGESTRDGEGPARAVGAMLAESPAAARASQADESAPAFAGTGSSVAQACACRPRPWIRRRAMRGQRLCRRRRAPPRVLEIRSRCTSAAKMASKGSYASRCGDRTCAPPSLRTIRSLPSGSRAGSTACSAPFSTVASPKRV